MKKIIIGLLIAISVTLAASFEQYEVVVKPSLKVRDYPEQNATMINSLYFGSPIDADCSIEKSHTNLLNQKIVVTWCRTIDGKFIMEKWIKTSTNEHNIYLRKTKK